MTNPQPTKASPMKLRKGAKGIGLGSRTTFFSVKKFRMSRVQQGVWIAGAVVILGALVWCALYFVS